MGGQTELGSTEAVGTRITVTLPDIFIQKNDRAMRNTDDLEQETMGVLHHGTLVARRMRFVDTQSLDLTYNIAGQMGTLQ
jgi:hypothetical protein